MNQEETARTHVSRKGGTSHMCPDANRPHRAQRRSCSHVLKVGKLGRRSLSSRVVKNKGTFSEYIHEIECIRSTGPRRFYPSDIFLDDAIQQDGMWLGE